MPDEISIHDLQKVLWELKEMEGLAAPRMALEELSDHWLSELITFLMERKCVLEVLRLLLVMGDDERDLPDEQETRREDGLSFYTRWLPNFYSSCHLGRNNAGTGSARMQCPPFCKNDKKCIQFP